MHGIELRRLHIAIVGVYKLRPALGELGLQTLWCQLGRFTLRHLVVLRSVHLCSIGFIIVASMHVESRMLKSLLLVVKVERAQGTTFISVRG